MTAFNYHRKKILRKLPFLASWPFVRTSNATALFYPAARKIWYAFCQFVIYLLCELEFDQITDDLITQMVALSAVLNMSPCLSYSKKSTAIPQLFSLLAVLSVHVCF